MEPRDVIFEVRDSMSAVLVIYIVVLLLGGAVGWAVMETMLTEANQQLPDENRIRRTIWNRTGLRSGEMSRLWNVHQQTRPNSPLRIWCVILWIFIPIWMFFGLTLLQRLAKGW
jgi:hypothetical protein